MRNFVRIDADSIPLEQLRISDIHRPDPTPPGFEDGAVLPVAESRRSVDNDTLESIVANSDTPSSALIELVDPPGDMLAVAQEWAFSDPDDQEAQKALEEVGLEFDAKYIGRRPSLGGLLTTTFNTNLNVIPGLHADNRDNKPRGTRLESHRRMGVNPGEGNRWLLACIPDLLVMSDELGYGEDYLPPNSNDPFREFVDKRPGSARCLWIPLPPGVAYLAPTDCMGHDGSTLGSQERSAIVMYLGHWARGGWAQPERI